MKREKSGVEEQLNELGVVFWFSCEQLLPVLHLTGNYTDLLVWCLVESIILQLFVFIYLSLLFIYS